MVKYHIKFVITIKPYLEDRKGEKNAKDYETYNGSCIAGVDGSGVDRNCAAESISVNNLPVLSKFEEFAK